MSPRAPRPGRSEDSNAHREPPPSAQVEARQRPASISAQTWSKREREILAATLTVVQEVGFDRMTVDEVAARAHASKMTVYRRWPSKADLVVAAVSHGIGEVAVPPDTGTLRSDLLALGRLILEQLAAHGDTIVGVLPEVRHNAGLRSVLESQFLEQRRALVRTVLAQAVERGEIAEQALQDELWDLLPGYLVFRSLLPTRPLTPQTVTTLVDGVLLPSLQRFQTD